MEFIKNINKDFILSPDYKLGDIKDLNQGDLRVKIKEIDMGGVTFVISDFKGIEAMVDVVANKMIGDLKKRIQKWKKVVNKIIEEWDKAPSKFKQQTGPHNNNTYVNTSLLTDDEYHTNIFVHFQGVYLSFHDSSFVTGYGGHTFYNKGYHVDALAKIDVWGEKTIKEIQSTKIREKIKKAIIRMNIEFSYPQLLKYISIPDTTVKTVKSKRGKRPRFPMVLDGDTLNGILDNDMLSIDDGVIAYFKEEYDADLSPLNGWELSYDYEGEHYHDGQVCEYTVTFISPEGYSYEAYDNHCLMNGWSFNGPVTIR